MNNGKSTYLSYTSQVVGFLANRNEKYSAGPFENRFPCDYPTFQSKARWLTGVAIGKANQAGALGGSDWVFVHDAKNKILLLWHCYKVLNNNAFVVNAT